mmetsp:Transcript_21082/g.61288  ORF Transcript_21082/g.61288 Transcript_21082/m.61288 type:complete len:194 (-) Transcript_21082:32-613(-)
MFSSGEMNSDGIFPGTPTKREDARILALFFEGSTRRASSTTSESAAAAATASAAATPPSRAGTPTDEEISAATAGPSTVRALDGVYGPDPDDEEVVRFRLFFLPVFPPTEDPELTEAFLSPPTPVLHGKAAAAASAPPRKLDDNGTSVREVEEAPRPKRVANAKKAASDTRVARIADGFQSLTSLKKGYRCWW